MCNSVIKHAIVIVDDDPVIRALISDYLESLGHQITAYESAQQALDALTLSLPELMIVDMQMPLMSGGELIQHLRGDSRWAGIPVILCSAANDIEQQLTTNYNVHAERYLSKPFDIATLHRYIEEILS